MTLLADILKVIVSTKVQVTQSETQCGLEEIKTVNLVGPTIDIEGFNRRSKQVGEIMKQVEDARNSPDYEQLAIEARKKIRTIVLQHG